MKTTTLTLSIIFAALSTAAFAVDGVTLISQATVQAAGGFPFIINQPGSYKLAGNLTVANTSAIKITAANVSLDLGGFTISSTGSAGVPGIVSTALATSISNGAVTGFVGPITQQPFGIYFTTDQASVDHVRLSYNGWGIFAAGSLSATNISSNASLVGLECDGVLTVSGSQFRANNNWGIIGSIVNVTTSAFDGNGGGIADGAIVIDLPWGALRAGAGTVINNTFTNNQSRNVYSVSSGSPLLVGMNIFFPSIPFGSYITSLGNNVCETGASPSPTC